ncbi:hydrolase family protein / HAD-superfamily protein isoform 2 [Galdieria sulphuraria]|uniref:Hydrolase family protein / HAD-superfamily protein isoform 2 n=1 Tax=Galdieria sulphuraria TaxID=130081 RepID=M2XZ64_GALSU|nr:hydrolase family protein / HAD-superfamily protein isoform 2 [Galdieria sulphuraria]EME28938.1 hydrolase family protein / HAD-superfamily protein isoform 2 [Galdieria sulphuraria]|eukprot:XP_005705458.1 hydrolase family protein / HAD-superfamily protein isoform 2 [Galdieria sulphuraria]
MLSRLWTLQCYERYSSIKTFRKPYSISNNKAAAFVFDIDGVLIRGKQVLDPAKKALFELYKMYNRKKFPIAFLTNGGGCTETEKARSGQSDGQPFFKTVLMRNRQLSEWFNLPIQNDQIVLSHTPLRELSAKYNEKDWAVVCVGRGHPDFVASSYGFRNVIPIEEIGRLEPSATPFCDYEKVSKRTNWDQQALYKPIGGILVTCFLSCCSKYNYFLCAYRLCPIQPIGVEISKLFVIFCNRIVVLYFRHKKRFKFISPIQILYGLMSFLFLGAFRLALEKIYQELVGKPLPYIQYGKPCAVQYRFMEDLLRKQAISQGYTDLEVIYAIGDNPAADIRGARNAGKPWIPILVKTGCFSTNDGDNDPNDPADYVFQDVNEAISTLVQKLSSS